MYAGDGEGIKQPRQPCRFTKNLPGSCTKILFMSFANGVSSNLGRIRGVYCFMAYKGAKGDGKLFSGVPFTWFILPSRSGSEKSLIVYGWDCRAKAWTTDRDIRI